MWFIYVSTGCVEQIWGIIMLHGAKVCSSIKLAASCCHCGCWCCTRKDAVNVSVCVCLCVCAYSTCARTHTHTLAH